MAEKKTKKERVKIETRAPQKRGIFDNLGKDRQPNVKHPLSEIIIFPDDAVKDNRSDSPTILPTYLPTNLPIPNKTQPVSPEKDFSKVPNSIKRAVENGLFPNSSLAIYLYLYSLTRGAIQPKRSIRVNKSKLLIGANLRAEKSLLKNLAHLKNVGLVRITVFNGDHLGNEFEVFVPEEITGDRPTHLPTEQPTYLPNKHTLVPTEQTLVGRWVEATEDKDTYSSAKTSFKDIEKNDDEAFAAMLIIFKEMSEKISGKSSNENQKENWQQLAELLKMELEIAAARTKSVSNVPAFLTEHLRRRLLGKPTIAKHEVSNSLQVGKQIEPKAEEVEEYQAEPLSKEGRETVLKTMREYLDKGQNEFIMSFQDTYTQEDWDWLTQELKQENSSKRP
ncbi:MAG: hypothetical protein WKF90_14695 [Pyrinomonadaceae bacterium]